MTSGRDSSRAVLLMAYGTPETAADVEPYFTHIRGGRRPSAEAVERLTERYARVGGRTPLLDITRAVAAGLEHELAARGAPARVYIGMKHWHPYIGETLSRMAADGVERVTALVLAPHYSRMSVGRYRHALEAGSAALDRRFDLRLVESWHARPEFIAMMRGLVHDALGTFSPECRERVVTVFSAHSLPVRIREWDDPYERELLESSAAVAAACGITGWRFAWQSAGETGEPWIGPDITDYLETLRAEGVRHVLQVPIGFVSDHLEILWDIDIVAEETATALGMTLRRTQLPNARPEFIRTLAAVVTEAGAPAGAVADRGA